MNNLNPQTIVDRKKEYEKINNEIEYLINYYLDLQDYLEENNLKRPDYFLLILNISKYYKVLNISRDYLEKWYQEDNNNLLTNCRKYIPNKLILKRNICENITNIKKSISNLDKLLEEEKENQKTNK